MRKGKLFNILTLLSLLTSCSSGNQFSSVHNLVESFNEPISVYSYVQAPFTKTTGLEEFHVTDFYQSGDHFINGPYTSFIIEGSWINIKLSGLNSIYAGQYCIFPFLKYFFQP